eukprot:600917-Prymnesium_polylepis.1
MLLALARAMRRLNTSHRLSFWSHATRGALWTSEGRRARKIKTISPLLATPMRSGCWHALTDTSLTPHTP